MTIRAAAGQPTGVDAAVPLLFPLGHDIGAYYQAGSSVEPSRRVRLGPRHHELTRQQFVVWRLAHGSQEAIQSDTPWGRHSVETLAKATGIVDAVDLVDELTEKGLLIEVAPESRDARSFAVGHRLLPLMLGLGNSPKEPWLFGIGLVDLPIVKVTFPVFDLWQWSSMDETLWDACRGAAEIAERHGVDDPESTDPKLLLTGILGALHGLLAAGAAHLDIAFRLQHPHPKAAA